MISLGVEYLMGRAMATDPANRNRAEWPPHPDRLYQAMVATWHETEGTADERRALEWLERQGPPELAVSGASQRSSVTHYVPVNDNQSGSAVLPDRRPRQPRTFPCAIPHDPRVYFHWSAAPTAAIARSLEDLASRVSRLGHSASPVRVWIEDNAPQPNWVPSGSGRVERLRVMGSGRLEQLERDFALGRRPSTARHCAYGAPGPETADTTPTTVFDPNLVVLSRSSGTRVGLEHTLRVMRTVRETVIKLCPDPVPEWVSGHAPGGGPSTSPHLAFIPLGDVGHGYSDGHLLGAALVLPGEVTPEEIQSCLAAVLGRADTQGIALYAGRHFEWQVATEQRTSPPLALRSSTWVGPANKWATVTPMAFDRHSKRRRGNDPQEQDRAAIERACSAIGLPRPTDATAAPVSRFSGVPHVRDFPGMRRKSDGGVTHKAHVVVEFEEPVVGPVILGAGRFRGYGLCRPLQDGDDNR